MNLSKMVTSVITIISLIVTTISGLMPEKEEPVYPQISEVTDKRDYEEGEFVLNTYDLVVANNGNDNWSGRLESPNAAMDDGPLRTIQAAKEKMKQYRDIDWAGTFTVWIREGTYYFNETLQFNSEDTANVKYKAYPGEKVIISGAKPISGWSEEQVNGVSAWVTQVDMSGGGFNTLYNSSTSLPRTRYPENGYLYVDSINEGDELNPDKDLIYFHMSTSFNAKAGDLSNFRNITDVNVRILHWWKDEIVTIKTFDEVTGKVKISRPTSMTVMKGDKYFLENVFETLNSPGEWYLDRATGRLYYIPFEDEKPESTVLYAGQTPQLISINGKDGIGFEGIIFAYTEWTIPKNNEEMDNSSQAGYDATGAFYVLNANHISVINCKFFNIGQGCIKLGVNVKDSSVRSCLFENVGAQAVFVEGENVPLDSEKITRNIKITDNHICGYGRRFFNAVGVLIIHANSCDVSNNEIHDGYYTAVSVGWVWGYGYTVTDNNKICNNLIYDIGQGWLSDMGGIYTLGMQPNTVISGNVIHNVAADKNQGGYGGWGIYLDEGSSGITVTKNLCYDCGSHGFHQHYGRENILINNIFALNGVGQAQVSRKEEHISLYFKKNIFLSDNNPIFCGVDRNKFVDEGNLFWDNARGKCVVSTKKTGETIKRLNYCHKLSMKIMGYYRNAVFKDPWFRDVKAFDFTLAENSPAIKELGFEVWDYSCAGTLTNISLLNAI